MEGKMVILRNISILFLSLTLFLVYQACQGIIFENENTTEGMFNVLRRIPSYLPSKGEGEDQHFVSANVIVDQLTVDRAVNALMAQQNGYTEEERMTGLNIGIAEFFTGNYNGNILYCISYGSHNTLEHLIYQNIYMNSCNQFLLFCF